MSKLPTSFGDGEATVFRDTRSDASARDEARFEPDDVFARIAAWVPRTLPPDALDRDKIPLDGDHSLNPWEISADFLAATRVAAVLIGLVERDGALQVILTQRASTLRVHSGQIAFPGGKMDPGDLSPGATALREVQEEIGLAGDRIEVLGYLGAYLTRTGFRVIPVVARVTPPFEPVLDPAEVSEVFEVPFAFLMSEANHQLREREWKGLPRQFYAMPYGERNIWGITAGILRNLYERLYRR